MLTAFDINPLVFGIIVVLFVELAQIHPPLGINLFVIQSVWGGKFRDVVVGAIPFCCIIVLMAFLVVFFPQIVLWLPDHLSQ
jgi:TRAP-type C4-dicarboxylate transport system permease large subunit